MDNQKSIWTKLIDFWNSWTGTFVVVFFVIFFVAQAFMIPSSSMEKTLLIGDGVFGKKFAYGIAIPRIPWLEVPVLPDLDGDGHLFNGSLPQRGDIVIFRPPFDDKVHFVKRLVATGGDKVMVRDKELYIHHAEGDEYIKTNFADADVIVYDNELWVRDPYAKEHKGINHDDLIWDNGMYPEPIFNFGPIKVAEGEYFMMGDNRDHSNDSRFWGAVPYKYIVGTPWFIYFSINSETDWTIRWNRMFKSVNTIEEEMREGKL